MLNIILAKSVVYSNKTYLVQFFENGSTSIKREGYLDVKFDNGLRITEILIGNPPKTETKEKLTIDYDNAQFSGVYHIIYARGMFSDLKIQRSLECLPQEEFVRSVDGMVGSMELSPKVPINVKSLYEILHEASNAPLNRRNNILAQRVESMQQKLGIKQPAPAIAL